MATIGFIGLGIMGAPMAGHLLDAGYNVVTSDHRKPAPADLVAKGLKAARGNKAVAETADIIITMVPDTPQVADVLFGENGVSEGLSKGKLVIDMSSISPIETKEFAKKINALGCDYLDAPVSGGEVGAKAASLTIMVGGEEKAFDRAKPVFEKMGKNITLVGPNGVGQTTKVANQIVVALTIEAVAEALVFASKAGADPAKVRQALMGGLGCLAHPRSAWRAHGQAHVPAGLPHRTAPEGSQSRAGGRESARGSVAEHLDHPAVVQLMRGQWRCEGGSLSAGAGTGEDGRARGGVNKIPAFGKRSQKIGKPDQ